MAEEITEKLVSFPLELQWVFLQHLAKNPFPDLPMSFINLWLTLPPGPDKEERAQFLLSLLDWVRAMVELNVIWGELVQRDVGVGGGEVLGMGKKVSNGVGAVGNGKSGEGGGESDIAGCDKRTGEGDDESRAVDAEVRERTGGDEELPLPRMLLSMRGACRGVLPDTIRLEDSSGDPVIERWLYTAHSMLLGLRIVKLLSDTDKGDLSLLVERLRGVNAQDGITDLPFRDADTESRVESALCPLLEGSYWTNVNARAKAHCVYLYSEFLYRCWTTHPLVLDFMRDELKRLPIVMQFAVLQCLAGASSRELQEAMVWIVR